MKQRIQILERAYDKAAGLVPKPLTEIEARTLYKALALSRKLAQPQREEYRNQIRQHFGWDTPEAEEKFQQLLTDIREGRYVKFRPTSPR